MESIERECMGTSGAWIGLCLWGGWLLSRAHQCV